jgi:hypothetical protein
MSVELYDWLCLLVGLIGGISVYLWLDGPARAYRKQKRVADAIAYAKNTPLPCGCNAVVEPACPDCGSEFFFKGQSGGLSMNLKCVGCGHFWNWMGPFGFEHIDSHDRYFNHDHAHRIAEL